MQSKVKEIFGEDISLPGLFYYSPENPKLPEKWRELGKEARKQFLADTENIPIAQKAYRLKVLNDLLDKQLNQEEALQNPVEMRNTMEQAAKEEGGMFTNRKEIGGIGGGAVVIHSKTLDEWNKDAGSRTNQAASVLEMFDDEAEKANPM